MLLVRDTPERERGPRVGCRDLGSGRYPAFIGSSLDRLWEFIIGCRHGSAYNLWVAQ